MQVYWYSFNCQRRYPSDRKHFLRPSDRKVKFYEYLQCLWVRNVWLILFTSICECCELSLKLSGCIHKRIVDKEMVDERNSTDEGGWYHLYFNHPFILHYSSHWVSRLLQMRNQLTNLGKPFCPSTKCSLWTGFILKTSNWFTGIISCCANQRMGDLCIVNFSRLCHPRTCRQTGENTTYGWAKARI